MKIKKIPFYMTTWVLMAGASLTIGLLSFGGILAIWPVLPVAIAAFVLSVAYEGEIYLQNIKGSLKKLFKSNHLERQLAKACLLEHFPLEEGKLPQDCPQFFKDYLNQLKLLHLLEHPAEGTRLNKASRDRKQRLEKSLIDMEKWFAEQLFSDGAGSTRYQQELREWMDKKELELRKTTKEKHASRHLIYRSLQIFCTIAGVFMGFGTTYLLVDAFAVIPWLAALPVSLMPVLIAPMAAVAGMAYGLLVYNAMTDMVGSEIVKKWQDKYKKYEKYENPVHKIGMGIVLSIMLTLTVALSICTAGTWWTVAKNTPPLFAWMGRMPAFIMLVLNPLISGVSIWAFNVENVSETLEMADERIDNDIAWLLNLPSAILGGLKGWISRASAWIFNTKTVSESLDESKTDGLSKVAPSDSQSLLQKLNPFRLLIQTFYPLLKLLFTGHLASVSATADRMPGVSPFMSMLLAFINELFEDIHYFTLGSKTSVEHKHDTESMLKERLSLGGGHNHDGDIPTKILTAAFSPVFVLAAAWNAIFSGDNETFQSWEAFGRAVDKEAGVEPEVNLEFGANNFCFNHTLVSSPAKVAVKSEMSVDTNSEAAVKKSRVRTKKKTTPEGVVPDMPWQFEHTVYLLKRYKEKHLQSSADSETINQLTKLQTTLQEYDVSSQYCTIEQPSLLPIKSVINNHCTFFAPGAREFLEAVPRRVLAGEWTPLRT